MSEASARTRTWREQKIKDGFQPLYVWLPAAMKHEMEDEAYRLHRDLSELLVEVWQARHPGPGRKPLSGELRQLKEQLRAEILGELTAHLQQVAAVAEEAAETVPQAMKQCRYGHAPYAGHREECPECVRQRKQRQRTRRRAQAAQQTL